MQEGVVTEQDCSAVYALLDYADWSFGNDDDLYTLDEILAGGAALQEEFADVNITEAMQEVDFDGSGAWD